MGSGPMRPMPTAIAHLYAAKGRPAFNPLIAHVADLAAARRIGRFDARALSLAEAFWPGPLTLVVPKADGCPVADLATAGLDTVAIRIPAHPVAEAILRAFGGAVVAPSANISGHVSPTQAAHVASDLSGRIDLIVDGGPVEVGVESTIVGCFEAPILLRPGGLSRGQDRGGARRAAGAAAGGCRERRQPAPGAGHAGLALRAARAVRLDARYVTPGEALLGLRAGGPARTRARRSRDESVAHAAISMKPPRNLFGYLRALDAKAPRGIAVMPIPEEGLGEAINDRLRRAAVAR